jgi:ribosome recycling factor|tara:strand:- start:38 stop:595 length:558 start_codon:yes stop_codon:yes gene_type:complete
MINDIQIEAENRMKKSVNSLQKNLTKIRTGRANTSLLDQISIDYYGSNVPLNQVANVGIEDSRTLKITPWEKDMVQIVEKAIMSSDLGLNPTTAGMIIRIPLPPLTEERRKDLIRVVKQDGEQSKISIRNIRRDSLGDIKELLSEKMIGEDEERKGQELIQSLTDKYVNEVDKIVSTKEDDLMVI